MTRAPVTRATLQAKSLLYEKRYKIIRGDKTAIVGLQRKLINNVAPIQIHNPPTLSFVDLIESKMLSNANTTAKLCYQRAVAQVLDKEVPNQNAAEIINELLKERNLDDILNIINTVIIDVITAIIICMEL